MTKKTFAILIGLLLVVPVAFFGISKTLADAPEVAIALDDEKESVSVEIAEGLSNDQEIVVLVFDPQWDGALDLIENQDHIVYLNQYTYQSGVFQFKFLLNKAPMPGEYSLLIFTKESLITETFAFAEGEAITHTIKLNVSGGTLPYGAPTSIKVDEPKAIGTLPTPTRAGYTFAGWYDARTGGEAISATYRPKASKTLYAQWSRVFSTITLDANEGSLPDGASTSLEVSYQSVIGVIPTPTRAGYTFTGWYSEKTDGTKISMTYKPAGSMTIYAQWKQIVYTITLNVNKGTLVAGTPTSFEVADQAEIGTLPTPSRVGYTFKGWYDALTGGTKVSETYKVTGRKTLYAQWNQATAGAEQAVIALINAIGNVTQASAAKIDAARSAYNALTEPQKALVTNYSVLTAAEAAYAQLSTDQETAAAVIADINAIGTVTLSETSKAKIEAARIAYNRLTISQQAQVTNISVLKLAEAEYNRLLAGATVADAQAAIRVILQIADIAPVELTDACKAKIDAARAAYDALTAAQKAKVSNLSTLTAAESAYAKLEAAAPVVPIVDGNLIYQVVRTASAKTAGAVEVVGVTKKTLTKISVKDSIKIGSATYNIEGIAKNAFKNNKKLKTLTIGNNVKEIEDAAMSGCKALTKVTIGKNVTKIGKNVFYKNAKLKTVKINSRKLTNVDKNTFKGAHKKAKITVPSK